MENNFIIILGAIVCIAFIIFIIITVKEFVKMSENNFNEDRNKGAESFLNTIGKPYDTPFNKKK